MDSHDSAGLGEAAFEVRSSDGTPIAVWVQGDGPPLVLVHGSLRDHRVFEPLIAHLHRGLRTYAVDRRGFGSSGDTQTYSIEQEFRDLAAVVDVLASRHGQGVALLGHSYGAGCAMGAAAITANVNRLLLYEPGLGIQYPAGWIESQEKALAAGRAEDVIHAVLTDILEMTEDEVNSRKVGPLWADYLAAAPTVLREARVEHSWEYRQGALDGIKARTLMLVGTETSCALLRSTLRAMSAIRNAEPRVLDGHGHLALLTHPAMIASIVLRFVDSP